MEIVRHDDVGCRGTATMTAKHFIIAAAVLLSVATWAQDDGDQLDLLDQMLVDMQDQTRSELVNRVRALEIENGELREELLSLRKEYADTRNGELEAALGDLTAENQALRAAVQALTKGAEAEAVTAVPEPEPVSGMLPGADPGEAEEIASAPANHDMAYSVMKEWGRSPEVTAGMPGDVASLKGMSIYVYPDGDAGELEELVRNLRAAHDEYDNINIEIFDNADAAREFADAGRASPRHRIASISRHLKSGRDKIFLFRNGSAHELLK